MNVLIAIIAENKGDNSNIYSMNPFKSRVFAGKLNTQKIDLKSS